MASEGIMARLSGIGLSRTVLPVLAVVAIGATAYLVATGQPDRSQEGAVVTPPRASSAFGNIPSVSASGVIEPSSEVINIGTSLGGLVTKVYVSPGEQVARGEPLFAVDDRAIRAQISEASAAITRAQSSRSASNNALNTARQQLALYNGIEDRRAISRTELIDRQGAVRAAQEQIAQAGADIRSAQAALASAQTDLSRLIVRAPISAEILSVSVRPGEFVNPGGAQGGGNAKPYMQIGNTQPMHVRIDIDENEINRVKMGSEAIISPRGNAKQRVKAIFVRAEPVVTPKTSLTNAASERVDVRVLQILYQLPLESGLYVGQQVDAFVQASSEATKTADTDQKKAASK